MKKFLFLLACLFTLTAVSAQTDTKTFKVADFTALAANGIADVECVKDASQAGKIIITAKNFPLDAIEVTSQNGTLTINTKNESNFSWFKRSKVKVVAYFSNYIANVSINGTGNVNADTFSNASGDVTLKSNGTGDIIANSVIAANANFATNGTGDIKISNVKASSISALASGTGDVKIDNIDNASVVNATATGTGDVSISGSAKNAIYTATGMGDVNCGALKTNTVTMKASGMGDVYYYGEAKVVSYDGRKGLLHPVK